MHRINNIQYTQNDAAQNTDNRVEFGYENRDDDVVRYQAGASRVINKRLSKVTVKSDGNVVRQYDLNYQVYGETYHGKLFDSPLKTSRLREIELCFGGSTTACAEPIEFDLSELSSQSLMYVDALANDYDPFQSARDAGETYFHRDITADFNGDGVQDVLLSHSTNPSNTCPSRSTPPATLSTNEQLLYYFDGKTDEVICFLVKKAPGTELGPFARTVYTGTGSGSSPNNSGLPTYFALDVNSDGRVDLVSGDTQGQGGLYVAISSESGFANDPSYHIDSDETHSYFRWDGSGYYGTGDWAFRLVYRDMNGDGLIDVLRIPPYRNGDVNSSQIGSGTIYAGDWTEGATQISVSLNTGSGFGAFSTWLSASQTSEFVYSGRANLNDVNGDGLPDLVADSGDVAINQNGSFSLDSTWSSQINDGLASNTFTQYVEQFASQGLVQLADVNGDGYSDLLRIGGDRDPNGPYDGNIYVNLSTGKQFLPPQFFGRVDVHLDDDSIMANRYETDPYVEDTFYSFQMVDYNQDGAQDLVFTRKQVCGYCVTLTATGVQLSRREVVSEDGFEPAFYPSGTDVVGSAFAFFDRFADFNADGFLEKGTGSEASQFNGLEHNAIQKVLNGSGYQVSVNYDSLAKGYIYSISDSAVSTVSTVIDNFGIDTGGVQTNVDEGIENITSPEGVSGRYGVSEVTLENSSSSLTETYHYYDAKYAHGGYGSLGFAKVDKTKTWLAQNNTQDDSSIKTVTEWHQDVDGDTDHDYRLVGKVKRQFTCIVDLAIQACVESGSELNLLSDTHNRWKVRIYDDDVDSGFDSPHFFPYVYQSSVRSWDTNGNKISDFRTELNNTGTTFSCSVLSNAEYSGVLTTTSNTVDYSSYGVPLYTRTTVCDESDSTQEITANAIQNSSISNFTANGYWVVGQVGQLNTYAYAANALSNMSATEESRRTNYDYYQTDTGNNLTGMLKVETIEPGNTLLEIANTYTYNAYGSVNSVEESWFDSINQSRTTNSNETFSSNGERTVSVTNPLNQIETTIYEARFGLPRKITDINNLNTLTSYDPVGRLDTITYPDGTTTTSDYRTCSGTCFEDSEHEVWYLQTKTTGSKDIRTYFDGLDRELGSRTYGLKGTRIYTSQGYDAQDNIAYSYDPYYSSTAVANRARTDFDYDLLGRATRVDYADGSYSTTVYNGLTHTFTNQEGQSQTRLHNGAGWVMNSTDNANTPVDFTYTPWGDLKTTQVNGATGADTKVNIDYDNLGRKIKLDDPNTGVIDYVYGPLGRLDYEINARTQKTTYDYDLLDRQIRRIDDADAANPAGRTSTWVYDNAAGKGVGQLASIAGKNTDGSDFSETYAYDSLGRAITVETEIDGQTFVAETVYDSYSRVAGTMYPTGYAIRNLYNSYGHLQEIENAETDNHDPLWKANTADARGNITQFTLGNMVVTDQTFDPDFGRIDSIRASKSGFEIQDHEYEFSSLGNLIWRKDTTGDRDLTEHFCYDNMNRLTAQGFGFNCGSIDDYTYDVYGNIKTRTGVSGTYGYGSNAGPNAVTSADGNTYGYDATGNLISSSDGTSVQYTSYNKPTTISKEGNSSTVVYGPNQSRVKRSDSNGRSTIYAGLGNFEETTDSVTGITEQIHYLGGFGSYIVQTGAAYDDYYLYQHTDHIGSIVAKSDGTASSESNIEWLANDPWGERLVETWDGALESNDYIPLGTSRGFTDHEHLDGVGLIHMNGRVYDPTLGRFMSPDVFIQAPYNTQSYNRYSYVFNNPLSFIDPTGFACQDPYDSVCAAEIMQEFFKSVAAACENGGGCSDAYEKYVNEGAGLAFEAPEDSIVLGENTDGLSILDPSTKMLYFVGSDGLLIEAATIEEYTEQVVTNAVVMIAGSAVGAMQGRSNLNTTVPRGPLQNASGNLDDAARAARTQPHNTPNLTQHARERMAGSRGDGQVISSDRVQDALTNGTITSTRGPVVTRTISAGESASGRGLKVVEDVRTNNVITVIDQGSKR